MKKTIILFIVMLGLGLAFSCKKEVKDPVLDMNQTVNPGIINPQDGSDFVLLKDEAENLINFTWTASQYNLTDLESTKYILQMDFADSAFLNPVELTSTTDLSYSLSVEAFNQKLIGMGAPEEEASSIVFRLMSYINNETEYSTVYSGFITSTITTYKSSGPVDYPMLWVPGDYQGWSPADAPNIFSFNSDNIYTGYIYMPEGGTYEFKFTSEPTWDGTNYGSAGEGLLDTDAEAGNLSVPGPGGYQVEVDVDGLTWVYTLENWGVIGEWLEWADDIDMLWDAVNQELYVTIENIPAAENQRFKFRANDAWDLNLGANDPDDGTLVAGGADIAIPDGGTITFYLRFTTPTPTYEIVYE
jgi:hypothetical protein